MNPNVSSSLIHFTNDINSLKGILTNGFRYSYCKEKYPSAMVNNIVNKDNVGFKPNNFCSNKDHCNVLIPMVSFCDIPLTRSEVHAKKYGYYGVGIDREFARKIYEDLMPVQYMSSKRYELALSELSMIFADSKNLSQQIINSIKLIIGTTKSYSIVRNKKKTLCYEEREWRIFHSDDENAPWGWEISNDNVKSMKDAYDQKLQTNSSLLFLAFIYDVDSTCERTVNEYLDKLITHIIVKKEMQIPVIAKFILNEKNTIFGYKLSKNCRLLLVSKLISFERLTKDF